MRPGLGPAGRLALLPLLVAALGPGACGAPAQSCPFVTPVCPTPPPSYSGQVRAVIQTFCLGCHAPGGQESVRPFTTYDEIFANGDLSVNVGPMQRQLLSCQMPPATSAQPTPDEKAALVGWLTCGAPNN